ncbi:MAG: LMBR1 domain-containing protein [Thermoplasmata archaeon]|nr:LMBR1 domain-containing protein [Thermoplasmata archaeon]
MAVATIRMEGGDPVFADGLDASSRRIHRLFGWAVIQAVVGVLLAFVRSRSRGGRAAATIANMAWGTATYFVVPVLLFEDHGPFSAIGRSAGIVRRTWREALAGNFGMGAVFLGLFLPGLFFSLFAYGLAGFVGVFIFIVAYVSVLSVFSSAAHGVLLAALYRLARTGKAPEEIESYEPLVRNVSRFARPSVAEYDQSTDNARGYQLLRRM